MDQHHKSFETANEIIKKLFKYPNLKHFLESKRPPLLRHLRGESIFYELLTCAASLLQKNPAVNEKVYLALWDDFCLKDGSVERLLFRHDNDNILIKNLMLSKKFNLIEEIVNNLSDKEQIDFFFKYASTILIHLVPCKVKGIKFLNNLAIKCFKSQTEITLFEKNWLQFAMLEIDKEVDDECLISEIWSRILPALLYIFSEMHSSFEKNEKIKPIKESEIRKLLDITRKKPRKNGSNKKNKNRIRKMRKVKRNRRNKIKRGSGVFSVIDLSSDKEEA